MVKRVQRINLENLKKQITSGAEAKNINTLKKNKKLKALFDIVDQYNDQNKGDGKFDENEISIFNDLLNFADKNIDGKVDNNEIKNLLDYIKKNELKTALEEIERKKPKAKNNKTQDIPDITFKIGDKEYRLNNVIGGTIPNDNNDESIGNLNNILMMIDADDNKKDDYTALFKFVTTNGQIEMDKVNSLYDAINNETDFEKPIKTIIEEINNKAQQKNDEVRTPVNRELYGNIENVSVQKVNVNGKLKQYEIKFDDTDSPIIAEKIEKDAEENVLSAKFTLGENSNEIEIKAKTLGDMVQSLRNKLNELKNDKSKAADGAAGSRQTDDAAGSRQIDDAAEKKKDKNAQRNAYNNRINRMIDAKSNEQKTEIKNSFKNAEYEVKKGDTFYKLAKDQLVSEGTSSPTAAQIDARIAEICIANDMTLGINVLKAGAKLKLEKKPPEQVEQEEQVEEGGGQTDDAAGSGQTGVAAGGTASGSGQAEAQTSIKVTVPDGKDKEKIQKVFNDANKFLDELIAMKDKPEIETGRNDEQKYTWHQIKLDNGSWVILREYGDDSISLSISYDGDKADILYFTNTRGETTAWFDTDNTDGNWDGSIDGIDTKQVKGVIRKLFGGGRVGEDLYYQVKGGSLPWKTSKKISAITSDNALDAIMRFNELSPNEHITSYLCNEGFLSVNTIVAPAQKLLEKYKDNTTVNSSKQYKSLKDAVEKFRNSTVENIENYALDRVVDNAIDGLINFIEGK